MLDYVLVTHTGPEQLRHVWQTVERAAEFPDIVFRLN